jgi:hypothetical protein
MNVILIEKSKNAKPCNDYSKLILAARRTGYGEKGSGPWKSQGLDR